MDPLVTKLVGEANHTQRIERLLRELTELDITDAERARLGDGLAVVRALQARGVDSPRELTLWLVPALDADPAVRAEAMQAAQGNAPPPGVPDVEELPEPGPEADADRREAYLLQANIKEYEQRRLVFHPGKGPMASVPDDQYFSRYWSVRGGDNRRLRPRQFAQLTGDWDRLQRFRGEVALTIGGASAFAGAGAALIAAGFASQQVDDSELSVEEPTMPLEQAEDMAAVGIGLMAASLPSIGIPLALHGQMHTFYGRGRAQNQIEGFNNRLLKELGLRPEQVTLVPVLGGVRVVGRF